MDSQDFLSMFIEYLHEYSDDNETLSQLLMFLSYGWGDDKVGLIQLLCENGASYEAIKAVMTVFDE